MLLDGRITDDEFGDFVSVATAWRAGPEWLNVKRYVGGDRFSVKAALATLWDGGVVSGEFEAT